MAGKKVVAASKIDTVHSSLEWTPSAIYSPKTFNQHLLVEDSIEEIQRNTEEMKHVMRTIARRLERIELRLDLPRGQGRIGRYDKDNNPLPKRQGQHVQPTRMLQEQRIQPLENVKRNFPRTSNCRTTLSRF